MSKNKSQFQISSNAVSWAGSNGLSYNATKPKQYNQVSQSSNMSMNFISNNPEESTSYQIISNHEKYKNEKGLTSNKKFSSFSNMQISSHSEDGKANSDQRITYIADTPQIKTKNYQIVNQNINKINYSNINSQQGISFIAENPQQKSKNFKITSNPDSSNNNLHQGLSFIAEKPKQKKYQISSNPNNNTTSHLDLTFIAEKPKLKAYTISSNSGNYTDDNSHQGISFLAEKSKIKQKKNEITSSSISYKNTNTYQGLSNISETPKPKGYNLQISSNNDSNQRITFLADNPKEKNKNLKISNNNSIHSISYIAEKPKQKQNNFVYISSNSNKYNSNKKSDIANNQNNDSNKKAFNYVASAQANNICYNAPEKKISNEFQKQKVSHSFSQTKPSNSNNITFISNYTKPKFEICGNENNSICYIQNQKKQPQKKFEVGNSHQEMTFICEGKKNSNLTLCNDQNFMYSKDYATGAHIFEQNNRQKF